MVHFTTMKSSPLDGPNFIVECHLLWGNQSMQQYIVQAPSVDWLPIIQQLVIPALVDAITVAPRAMTFQYKKWIELKK